MRQVWIRKIVTGFLSPILFLFFLLSIDWIKYGPASLMIFETSIVPFIFIFSLIVILPVSLFAERKTSPFYRLIFMWVSVAIIFLLDFIVTSILDGLHTVELTKIIDWGNLKVFLFVLFYWMIDEWIRKR